MPTNFRKVSGFPFLVGPSALELIWWHQCPSDSMADTGSGCFSCCFVGGELAKISVGTKP